ncbi:DMT family transporter [Corynebacterium xerosis]|uniref:DMT family transporter n=1 Tax=Corynebacterium xerosis TaxID=1725 RepID=A0ABV3UX68_9CORY
MSLTAAVGLMILSTFGFAGGAVFQHMSIRAEQRPGKEQALTLRQLGGQLREPQWLLGLLLIILGAALHVAALFLAPVTVVQPIGILAVPWSVLLASKIHGYRASRSVWLAVSVTVAGIVSFTVLSTRFSHEERASIDLPLVLIAVVLGCMIGAGLFTISRGASVAFRSLALAAGGAVLFGLTSALLKSLFVWLKVGESLLSPAAGFLCLGGIATCVVGGWMIQQAYAVGHPEVVVGALTTVDPVVAVVYGLVVLDEGMRINAPVVVAMLACGAVAALGVAGLARYHPEARQRASLAGAKCGRG